MQILQGSATAASALFWLISNIKWLPALYWNEFSLCPPNTLQPENLFLLQKLTHCLPLHQQASSSNYRKELTKSMGNCLQCLQTSGTLLDLTGNSKKKNHIIGVSLLFVGPWYLTGTLLPRSRVIPFNSFPVYVCHWLGTPVSVYLSACLPLSISLHHSPFFSVF